MSLSHAEAAALLAAKLEEDGFRKLTLSAPLSKSNPDQKVTLTAGIPVPGRWQLEVFTGSKVRHLNFDGPQAARAGLMLYWERRYKQCDIRLAGENVKILTNKRGCAVSKTPVPEDVTPGPPGKQYILRENQGRPNPWLAALGVTSADGKVLAPMQKKFRQINRYLEMVADVAVLLPGEPRVVDIGCGKAYLTFALYDYLVSLGKKPQITGIDLKADVLEDCQALADRLGYAGLRFAAADAREFRPDGTVDMVVSLHACDTATDLALADAVKWRARVILAAPCCQHELYGQLRNDALKPLLAQGVWRERLASLLTDGFRAQLLACAGYKCQIIEFVDSAHTPKNLLLRAVRHSGGPERDREARQAELLAMLGLFSAKPALYALLAEELGLPEQPWGL